MLRAQLLVIGFAAVWIVHLGALRGNAEPYHDTELHFSLTLPDGWKRMDDERLQELNADANPGEQATFIVGFVPEDASDSPGAQILLSFERLPMTDVTYDDLTAELKGTLANHLKFVVEKEDEPPKAPKVGEARLDRSRHRVSLRAPPQPTDYGNMHSYTVVALGNKGMVSVNCIDFDEDFQLSLPKFRSIADTLQFDAGHEFEPAIERPRRTRAMSWVKLTVWAVIFGSGAIAAWKRKQELARRRARMPKTLNWDET